MTLCQIEKKEKMKRKTLNCQDFIRGGFFRVHTRTELAALRTDRYLYVYKNIPLGFEKKNYIYMTKNNTVRVYHVANYKKGEKTKERELRVPIPNNYRVARDTLRLMYKLNSTFPFIIYDRTSSSVYCARVLKKKKKFYTDSPKLYQIPR